MPFLRPHDEASLAQAKGRLYRARNLSLLATLILWILFLAWLWSTPNRGEGLAVFMWPFAIAIVGAASLGAVLLVHLVALAVAGILVRARWPVWLAAILGLISGLVFTIGFAYAVMAIMGA